MVKLEDFLKKKNQQTTKMHAKLQKMLRVAKMLNKGDLFYIIRLYEPGDEISNIVVCATNKASDQPAHTRRLIRVFAFRLNIL